MFRVYFVMLAITFVIQGCATEPSEPAANIRDSDENRVASCKFLGTLTGDSLAGGRIGRSNAKNEALEKAVRIGATDMVWVSMAGSFSETGMAMGRAYYCN